MARIFTTGAEEVDTVALWDSYDFGVGTNTVYPIIKTGGQDDHANFNPRTGVGMYFLSSNMYLRKDFGSSTSNTELFWGFAVRVPSLSTGNIFTAFTDDSGVYANYMSVRLTTGGAVEATRSGTVVQASSVGIITINQWYYFEIWYKPLDSNGRIVVKIDGSTVIDYTGDTTAEEQYINAWQLGGVEESGARYPTAFDDIVCNDASGAVNNSYPGQVRLMPIRPNSSGANSDWTRAGVDLGSDEAQIRNGSWEFAMLQTSSADQKQTFTPEVPDLPAGATISNIVISSRARVESGAGVIAPMVNANGTENISTDQTLSSTWRYYQYAWAVNPEDSASWEEADLSTLKLGVSS